jgi:sugar (pentulose or hexulose) kinase
MKGLVSVDIGSTSMRAVLYDAEGRAGHVAQRATAPRYGPGGRVEQDARVWQDGLVELLAACGAAAGAQAIEPTCIAVTAQRSSVLAVDARGTPLHPTILWQDTRSAPLARAMADAEPLVYARTGLRISPVFSAIKMAWLRRTEPAVWAAAHKLIGIHDWALLQLTGRFVTDRSLASRTNLFHLDELDWDAELLALFGVPRSMLCEVVAPGSIVGGLVPGVARATGLVPGLPVVSAGGDQQCAALGLGLLSHSHAVANAGTGGFVIGHADHPLHDPAMRISCNVSAVPGAWIVEAATLTAGSVHEWLRGVTGGVDPMLLEAEAAQEPPGCHGVVMLPHFEGSGSPHWDPQARGAFVQLGLHTTRGALARAILEGVAIAFKEGLDVVEELCGAVDEVHVAGGMTRSALFNRIQADMYERPVMRFAGNEATAQGAWIAGALATGLAASHAQACARITEREPHERFLPDPAAYGICRRQRHRSHAVWEALAAPALRALFDAA